MKNAHFQFKKKATHTLFSEPMEVVVLQIGASDTYFSFGDVVEAFQQLDDGGLARARGAAQPHRLARLDLEGHSLLWFWREDERRKGRERGGESP